MAIAEWLQSLQEGGLLSTGLSLEELGINFCRREPLSESFPGPLQHNGELGPEELSPPREVPEYDISGSIEKAAAIAENPMEIRNRVQPYDFSKSSDDNLFYIFYQMVGDAMQVLAAAELYKRNWRYDTQQNQWITRSGKNHKKAVLERGPDFEKGYYSVFDPKAWKKVTKMLSVRYDSLEGPPTPINTDYLGQLMYPQMAQVQKEGFAMCACAMCTESVMTVDSTH